MLVNLPLALAGGVIGVFLGGGVLSIASIIGFITLFGIATRNGILLATRTRDLELEGVERTEAVAQSARERLAPILMTAVVAMMALIPLLLASGPGSEIQRPLATVPIATGPEDHKKEPTALAAKGTALPGRWNARWAGS